MIEESDNFKRSFKKLAKVHKNNFVLIVSRSLENLLDNPYPHNSCLEPLPSKIKLSQEWTFYKLKFRFAKGASGQIRLMYLVNEISYIIKPVWIYTHEQFAKRPADEDLKRVIRDILDFSTNS
ncbi:MAG: hypothetical protein WA865_15540 [Spirulinaceae cyanobacterium]